MTSPAPMAVLLLVLADGQPAPAVWKPLPPIPDREGFAGSFAGASDGALLVAGGANFPDRKPWEGGRKIWHNTVFVLDRPDGNWKPAGRLPRPLGYGVCVTWHDAVICVGGSDAERHYADAFALRWSDGRLVTTPLPPLPKPIANACGALLGDRLYVAGGQTSPDAPAALQSLFEIDLAAENPAWREAQPCPGAGRILAVAAAHDGAFYLAGGAALTPSKDGKVTRKYLTDAWRYTPRDGWERLPDLPAPSVAAPSPAPTDATGIYVLGGDDGTQLDATPQEHHGFPRTVYRFDTASRRWTLAGRMPAAHVTTPCVRWNDAWIIPGGEIRPGIRSTQVWSLRLITEPARDRD